MCGLLAVMSCFTATAIWRKCRRLPCRAGAFGRRSEHAALARRSAPEEFDTDAARKVFVGNHLREQTACGFDVEFFRRLALRQRRIGAPGCLARKLRHRPGDLRHLAKSPLQ